MVLRFYPRSYTLPPNSRIEDSIEVEGDLLKRVQVAFPPGPQWLLHVRLFYGIKQILPYEEDRWIEGDGETVTFDDVFELPEEKTKLIIKLWNEDDVYEHSCLVRLWVRRVEERLRYRISPEGELEVYV